MSDLVNIAIVRGIASWKMTRDEEGHRNYTVRFKVLAASTNDGPYTVMQTPNLPRTGALWAVGTDSDMGARCSPYMMLERLAQSDGEKGREWIVERKFTTRPVDKCQDSDVTDPSLEPPRISGGFASETREITHGLDVELSSWVPLRSSSQEQLRGAQVEFEFSRPTVTIEQTIPGTQFSLVQLSEYMNGVNGSVIWGMPARTVRLASASWSLKYWDDDYMCNIPFVVRTLTFEGNYETWDKNAVDEGTRCLGHWDADGETWIDDGDQEDPSSFRRYRDKDGEIDHVFLDGFGKPLRVDPESNLVTIPVRSYYSKNFFDLYGLPTSLYT